MKNTFLLGLAGLALAASAALSSTTASFAQQSDSIRLCTGSSTGVYFQVGSIIATFATNAGPIEVKSSGGTFDNMDRLLLPASDPNSCDAMIGQPDGPAFLKRTKPGDAAHITPTVKLHREYLQVLCSTESGITNLSQLSTKNRVAVGATGSGTWLIWQNFIEQDSKYGEIPVTSDSGDIALSAVQNNEVSCMLVAAGVPYDVVSTADAVYGDLIALVSATDKDFNDATDINGKPLYEWRDVPKKAYPVTFGRYWGAPETVSWNATLYVNKDKLTTAKLNALLKAAGRARAQVLSTFGQ